MKIVLLTLLVPNVVDQSTEDTISASLASALAALDDANHSQPWFVTYKYGQNSAPVITLSTFARAAETRLLTVTIATDAVVRNVLFDWTVTRSARTFLPLDGAIRRVLGARGSAVVSGSLNIRDPSSRY